MSENKPSIFQKLNPVNFKLEYKIHLLIFTVVFVTILYMGFAGLRMSRALLMETTSNYLQELALTKQEDIEMKIQRTTEWVREFATHDKYRLLANDLINAYQEINPGMLGTPGIEEIDEGLRTFYKDKLIPESPVTGEKLMNYYPLSEQALVAQYAYMVMNPEGPHNLSEFRGFDDYHAYNSAHRNAHKLLSEYVSSLNAKDVILVDPNNGDVVYSVSKNIDFGTNLLDGPLKSNSLSVAYRKALAGAEGQVFFEDYTIYAPDLDEPTAFFSAPVFYFDELQAVAIFLFGTDLLDQIVYSELELLKKGSLEYNVVGSDLKMRNNPKGYLADPEDYLRKLMRTRGNIEAQELYEHSRTGTIALAVGFPRASRTQLEAGQISQVKDFAGNWVLATSREVAFGDESLLLVVKVDRAEMLMSFVVKSRLYTLSVIVLLILVFILGRLFGKALSKRIRNLLDALVLLYKGEKAKALDSGAGDELGQTIDAYNQLRSRMVKAEEFAIEMSEGNFNFDFATLSNQDSLGTSLNVLKDRLIKTREENEKRKKEDEVRNWINTGIAKFNDLLRKNNDDINLLAYTIIENLVEYLDANQGGVFLVEGDSEPDKKIRLIASFAYDRRKFLEKTIEIGEGILGMVYHEKKSVYLKDIPADYIEITSGLGEATPRTLYILPLKLDENVLGMIEIASFNEITGDQVQFLDRVAESIASTFVSVRLNMQTATLLEESNRKAEEIAQQEEEMRQNMEEMQATQEELARLRQDDEKKTREMQLIVDNTRNLLKNLLDTIPGGYILKDPNGVIHLANAEGALFYGKQADVIVGKTDHELLPAALYKKEHKADEEVLEQGEMNYEEEVALKGEKIRFKVTKKQFHIEEIHQVGVLTIRHKL